MKMLLKDGKRKVLTLSYDDGVVHDKRLIEILDRHGLKCTFNLNSGCFNKGESDPVYGRMTKESAIKLFKDSGHEVAIHAYSHPHLELMHSDEMIYEITEDRRNLEKDFETIIRGMAYPYGTYNDEVLDVLRMCKIAYARTVRSTLNFALPKDWLELHPTCHHNNPELMNLAKRFLEINSPTGIFMFYLWGHSYEFNNDNNWEVIEQFAEFMGGHDDIWYATNIEIFDYVEAYKRLETSYDKKIIYNPSTTDVWVEIEKDVYCIKAGETLKL